MRGLVLASIALIVASLSGCLASGSDKYFPPASDLPDGLVPLSTESSEWKLVAPFLGLESNPGRLTVFDRLPQQDLGEIARVDAYLLHGPDGVETSYGVMAIHFNSTADVGEALRNGEGHACDGKEMSHVLKDGLVYVLVGGDGSTESGRSTLDKLATVIEQRSGATRLC